MQALGATPAGIAAAIGPCIRQPSYEVGPDLRDAVLAHHASDARFFAPQAALATGSSTSPATAPSASKASRPVDTLEGPTADTLADEPRFFSHRRRTLAGGGPIGHQISAIML